MKKSVDKIRKMVAETYTGMINAPTQAGWGCGCASTDTACGLGAANYSGEELASLPGETASNSFGCGNPLALAGLKAGDVVLDLGSGAGLDILLAAKRVGPRGRAIGIDMTDAMIAKANENIRAGKFTNVEVRKGIIEELPVEDASVDWVISNCVINLSPEKRKIFKEIARVLRPGGQMLVSDIVVKEMPKELLEATTAYAACIGGAISEEDYLAGLRAAGLTDVAVRDRLAYSASQLEGFIAKRLTASQIKALRSLDGKVWSAKIYGRKPA